jgi:hypothetical protein
MAIGEFTKSEAHRCLEAVEAIHSKIAGDQGEEIKLHLFQVELFLKAAMLDAPEEAVQP